VDAASPASKTAIMVAAYRARASEGDGAVCADPWAARLAGDDGFALAERFDARFPHMALWMGLRTRYLDHHVTHWTAAGFSQVVILGAGLDTRAARLAAAGVRFYEVDHPATQADKRRRLAALDEYPMEAAHYVPCDFESGADFFDELSSGGFDPNLPALILWEGVTPYLTEAAVRLTARRIATRFEPRSILLFDYVGKRMAEGRDIPDKDRATLRYVADLGEPIRWGTNHVLPLLYEEGFRHVRTVTFDDLALTYTGTYDRSREFRFQYVALASCVPPPAP
jgi:methyltransferase (TIGR00027 family)